MREGIDSAALLAPFPFYQYYILFLILSVIIALLAYVVFRSPDVPILSVACFALACLGFTIGVLTGNSRNAIMDATVTAMLSFIGGFSVFVYQRMNKALLVACSIAISILSSTLVYGAWVGAWSRTDAELKIKKDDAQIEVWKQVEILRYKAELEAARLEQLRGK